MTNRNKLLVAVSALVVLIAAAIWVWNPLQLTAAAGPVRVAANLPLSGVLASYGTSIRDGAIFALERTKSDGGPDLVFDWQDNAGVPTNAVTIMQKQFLENPAVYVSGIKPQTMAIINQVTSRGLPHFVWIFDAQINVNSSNNFRTLINYKIEAPVYVDYAVKRAAKKVSLVYVQVPHAIEEMEKLVIPGLKAKGITDIQAQDYDFGRSDFRDIAAKIKSFGPDLIILNGFQSHIVAMVRALRPLSLITDGNTIGTYDVLDAALVLGADELEGVRLVAPLFATRPQTEPIAGWTKAFMAKFNKPPLYYHAFSYDMVTVLKDAARRVGQNATSADWIKAIRATDIPGITGRLKFDADGDLITPIEVGVYRSGKLVPDTR